VRCCDSVETEVGGCPMAKGILAGVMSVSELDEAEVEGGESMEGGDLDGMG